MRRLHVLLAVGAAACSFAPEIEGTNSSGGPTTAGTGATDSATSTTAADGTSVGSGSATSTTAASTSEPSTTATGTATSTSTTATSTTTVGTTTFGTTGGGTDCWSGPGLLLWAADAEAVQAPMELIATDELPPCGSYDPIVYASSAMQDQGMIVWTFSTTQAVELDIFGLVFDELPGLDPSGLDPDSYHVTIDDMLEFTWVYGCETGTWTSEGWGWVTVRPVNGNTCSAGPITYPLDAGTHTIRLRTREGQMLGRRARVAALYLAVAPAPDPYTVYDPGS